MQAFGEGVDGAALGFVLEKEFFEGDAIDGRFGGRDVAGAVAAGGGRIGVGVGGVRGAGGWEGFACVDKVVEVVFGEGGGVPGV